MERLISALLKMVFTGCSEGGSVAAIGLAIFGDSGGSNDFFTG
jgi:hypothetical protein